MRGAPNSRWASKSTSKRVENRYSIENGIADSTIGSHDYECGLIDLSASYLGVLSSAGIFLRSSRECLLLKHYVDSFLPANILPSARADFSLIKLDIEGVPEVLDTVLACASMHLANKGEASPLEALNYYTRAISALRQRIYAGKVTGLEDWMSVVMILLHCFEV